MGRRMPMRNLRRIKKIFKSKPTLEGAGVHLKRAFGFHELPGLDPFLLLDDFHSNHPDDYIKGFPWHPHRGIETITYVLYGKVEHGDSMGNKGVIDSGDVQWMTAGSGIIHQEMPKGREDGWMWGFQLWANLPASHKMMDPRYRDVKRNQIPEITLNHDVKVKIICGEVNGVKGPVQDIVIDPEYLDITIPAKSHFTYPVKRGHTVFAYVIEGKGYFDQGRDSHVHEVEGVNDFDPKRGRLMGSENLILFDDGDEVAISAEEKSVRMLLISGRPIGEPVAWYGPIVMNTQEELRIAFEEYQNGTFIKHPHPRS
jgi:redox-sensitive bicupin YhaK (pirin superfamily)